MVHRGVTSGLTSETHEASRSAPCLSKNQKKFRTENTEYTERTQRNALGTPNFTGYRGVTNRTPRSAQCLFKTKRSFAQRTRSTQREHREMPWGRCGNALGTPNFSSACLWFLPGTHSKTCQLKSWRSQGYRDVAKRRSAYAAMPRCGNALGTPNFSSACLWFLSGALRKPPSV